MLYLVCQHDEKPQPWTVEIEDAPVLIGRARDAEVSLRDLSVSKNHVRIERRAGRYHFQDLGSRNGTFINEIRRDDGPLSEGDELRIGKIKVAFHRNPPPDRPPIAQEDPFAEFADRDGGQLDPDYDEELATMVVPTSPQLDALPPPMSATEAPAPISRSTSSRTTGPATRARRSSAAPVRAEPEPTRAPIERHRPERRSAEGLPIAFTIVACIACLLLGGLVGRLTAPGKEDPKPVAQGGSPATPTPGVSPSAADTLRTMPGGASTNPGTNAGKPTPLAPPPPKPDDIKSLLSGPRSDIADRDPSHRALFRLFLDVAGRSPTRLEVKQLIPLNHAERFQAVVDRAGAAATDLNDPKIAFARLLGRDLNSSEIDQVRSEVGGNFEEVAQRLAASRFYASLAHARTRSETQRANALWVDFIDDAPSPEKTNTVVQAVQELASEPQEIVRIFVDHKAGRISPEATQLGEEDWIRGLYLRFLFRSPSTEELETAKREMRAAKDGWKFVAQELSLRAEYLRY